MVRRKFADVTPDLSLNGFYSRRKFSIENFPSILIPAQPTVRNLINIGDDCSSNLPELESDFLKFVNDPSSKGTIVIAFGHMIKWSMAPNEIVQNLISVLNQLTDYRIVWQTDLDMQKVQIGKHVKTMAWIPQVNVE